MDSMYRGNLLTKDEFILKLPELRKTIETDLMNKPLKQDVIINALSKLANSINQEELIQTLTLLGLPKWSIEEYLKVSINSLKKEELENKLLRELGVNPFKWQSVNNQIEEKKQPLGVVMHIGAGNALGLAAFSVMEGLLTGNINILKLPEYEGGVSLIILAKLIEIEPKLKPYIYVINVSSKNELIINELIKLVDALVVWGGDDAIQALRQLTPPTIKIIEWGHRLSFSYFTKSKNEDKDLIELAKDIVLTDQLYCSSPQCVFYETDNFSELDDFAQRLSKEISNVSLLYPSSIRPMEVESQITWIHELIKMEEILNEKKLFTNKARDHSVMVDYVPKLKTSPLFRNIWVMPIKRNEIINLLRDEKGHLQTVGLSCEKEELNELSDIFYSSGVNRVMACGLMSSNYSGEPHDGEYALLRYVRIVNRRSNG